MRSLSIGCIGVCLLFVGCGGGGSGSSTNSPTLGQPNVNSAPVFSTPPSFQVLEGGLNVGTIELSDSDEQDSLSLAIVGGADQALFELGVCNASRCTSNALSFAASTDFENPSDVGLNNRYEVELEAFDGTARTKQTVAVDVLNAVEGRTVDAPLSDATVCVDTNEDSICGPGEEAVLTDSLGYYAAPEGSSPEGFELRVLSVGGTDIVTQKELASLALTADLPTDPSKPIAVTPLSSILSVATNPSDVLVALGFPASVTADDLVSLDPWALAGGESEASSDFAGATESAADIGVDVSVLENVAKDVVVVSAQIATLIQAADNAVASSTESGLQNAAERAAMISATVSSELIETIEAAIVNAGSASAAAVDVSDATFVQEVLKETIESSSAEILEVIQAKQETGELDLSDTSSTAAASILALQESQESIDQNGLDTAALAEIAAISSSVADVIAQIETSVDAGGTAALTNPTAARALSDLIATVNENISDLVTGVSKITDFETTTDVEDLVSVSGGLNDVVRQLPEGTGSSTSGGSTDTDSGTSGGSTDTGSGTNGGSTDTDSGTSGGSTDTGSGTSGGSTDTGSGTSEGSTDSGSGDTPAPNIGPTFETIGDKSVGQGIIDFSIAEGATSIATLVASDSNGDSLTFTLSGTDASDLTINSAGLLSFASAADYESAQDYDENNEYLARVTVSDSSLTDTVDLRITVTDVNETVSGVLIDGYLAGATVFQDLNNNGALDSGEPNTTSDVLGRFSLALLSASPDAPIRVVNSGFDIGANGVLTAMLDISPLSSGSFVMTPISTLSSRMLSFDGGMKKSVAEKIIADSLSIELAQAPSSSLFGYDPIALMAGDDSAQAEAAKPIYAANSLLMALGNASGALGVELGSSATSYINTQIQTVLNANGFVGFNPSLSFSDSKSLRSAGYTAFLDGFAEHLSNQKAPVDAFRMRPGTIQLIDFVDGVTENAHWIMPSTTGSTLDVSLVNAGLDRSNLNKVVSGSEGAKSPVLRFGLNSIPSSGTSGSMSAAVKIYDGKNTDRIDGERVVSTALNVNWSSLNGSVTFEAPSQTIAVSIVDSSGIGIERDVTNSQADFLSVASGGASTPASLELKIAKLIASLSSAGIDLADYFTAGDYTLAIEFTSLDLRDRDNVAIDKVISGFSVLEDPGVYVYVEDKTSFEGSPELAGKTPVQVNLSRIATSAVEVDYATASGSASAGADFTSTSGKLTIGIGESFGTIAVPVTDDTSNESAETFSVVLSNALNASLARSTATVTVIDNENVISNATALGDINSKALDAFGPQLLVPIQTLFEDTTATLNGQTKSYKSWLDGYVSDSDIESWVTTFVASKKSGASVALNSVIENVNTRVAAEQSTDLNTFAIGLTKIVAGVKPLDFGQYLFGSVINDDGTFAAGSTLTSFNTSLDSSIGSFISLAADTVGDPLGADTTANFPNATIVILTDGNDTYTGSDDSELIATLENTDTVDGKGGNDKIIGGGAIDTLSGGDGDDHLYGFGSNDNLNGGQGDDYLVGGLGDDTLNGQSGDDKIEAGSGDDKISTGPGVDTIFGGLGDDQISIDGAQAKTINGGSGTDTVNIDYGGISSLTDFSLSSSGDVVTLTDSSGGALSLSSVEALTVNSISYTPAPGGAINSGDGGLSNAYYSAAENSIHSWGGSVWYIQNINPSKAVTDNNLGLSPTSAVAYYGSDNQETLNLNVDRTSVTGTLNISLAGGNDSVLSAKLKNGDSLDMGAGDDTLYMMIGGSSGTPTITGASFTKLDGGLGTDTIAFAETTGSDGQSLTLSTAGAVNFENLLGSSYIETITGDDKANILAGDGGADTLYGNAGDDELLADGMGYSPAVGCAGSQTDADALYGGAGDDKLCGNEGDNTLDGGTGKDTITSGGGSDTIVVRSGDGSTDLANADVLTDFTDGSDVIGLDSVGFGLLDITQGSGDFINDTLIKLTSSGEYMLVLQGIASSNVGAPDFASTSTDNQTLTGDGSSNTLIGGAGNDTFNGGAGNDALYGSAGNDIFNVTGKSGTYVDSINGGSGTDTVNIDYGGISSLTDFSLSSSGDVVTLTDSSGGALSLSSVEALTVNSISYTPAPGGAINSGDGGLSNAYYSAAENSIHSWGGSVWYIQNINPSKAVTDNNLGLSPTSAIAYYGSDNQETLNLNVDRTSVTGTLNISLAGGNDSVLSAKLKNGDSLDMGAGDDTLYMMIGGSSGTPTITGASFAKLDGGLGTDTIAFTETTGSDGQSLTLGTAGAVNFENLLGSSYIETITGDDKANILAGDGGADTLYGNAGNDELLADGMGYSPAVGCAGSQTDADALYGGAGDDKLCGNAGDNTLDGGTGKDTMTSGGGSDTIVVRSGDGSTDLANADVLTDFTDGSDVIGLDSVGFGLLDITQGSGDFINDTLIKLTSSGEYLLVLQGIASSNVGAPDFASTSTDNQTLTGDGSSNTLIGGAGNDTFNGGAGNDALYGSAGNDIFNVTGKSGAYVDSINGGSGTDTVNIDYGGISSLTDFSLSSSGDVVTLTDTSGGTLSLSSVEALTVNSISYTPAPGGAINSGDGGLSNAYYSTAENSIHSWGGSVWYIQNIDPSKAVTDNNLGLSPTSAIAYYGSDNQETLNLNVDRTSVTGTLNISLAGGNDSVLSAKLKNGDSLDMGAGDDTLYMMIGGSSGTPTITGASFAKLDGGLGTDTIAFTETTGSDGQSLTLGTAGAVNFENLLGSSYIETITGDDKANILAGDGGADTLYGNAGNDELLADGMGYSPAVGCAGSQTDADALYGGAGDDKLCGNAGDNTLDGGTGKDTMTSGGGSDTIVVRSGDGSTDLANADVLTDFTDGSDVIGLDGLVFGDLSIDQGQGDNASDVIIKVGLETLLIIEDVQVGIIGSPDFNAI